MESKRSGALWIKRSIPVGDDRQFMTAKYNGEGVSLGTDVNLTPIMAPG